MSGVFSIEASDRPQSSSKGPPRSGGRVDRDRDRGDNRRDRGDRDDRPPRGQRGRPRLSSKEKDRVRICV